MIHDINLLHPRVSIDGNMQNGECHGEEVHIITLLGLFRDDFIRLRSIFLLYWKAGENEFPNENPRSLRTTFVDEKDFNIMIRTWKFSAARQSIYELDQFCLKIKNAIADSTWENQALPDKISDDLSWLLDEINQLFPSLRNIHNSIAHREEINQGRKLGKKSTILKSDFKRAHENFLMSKGSSLGESLINHIFCVTREGVVHEFDMGCLLYTSPSPRDRQKSRMPSSA